MKPRLQWLWKGCLASVSRLHPHPSLVRSLALAQRGSSVRNNATLALETKPYILPTHRIEEFTEAISQAAEQENESRPSLFYDDEVKKELLDLVPEYTGKRRDEEPPKESEIEHLKAELPEGDAQIVHDHGMAFSARRKQAFDDLKPVERERLSCFDDRLFDSGLTPEELFRAFMKLPPTRVILLRRKLLRRLLRSLSVIPNITPKQALNYLKVVVQVQEQGIRLTKYEWSSFIHLSSVVSGSASRDVDLALKSWVKMEDVGRIPSNVVSFTILLNATMKAKQYRLAEEILREMERRGIQPNRYMFVTQIGLYGRIGDGAGIRKVYKNLINAGEIVDTTVLNSLISALLGAGEPEAAEKVFQNMQDMYRLYKLPNRWRMPKFLKTMPQAHRLWWQRRQAGKVLRHANTKIPRTMSPSVFKSWSIGPNDQTFHVFISHYSQVGEYAKMCLMKHQMAKHVKLEVPTYSSIFDGFVRHGGHNSSWTAEELESVWQELRTRIAVYEVEVNPIAKHRIVEAFSKCCGPQRAHAIREELENLESLYIHGHAEV